MINYIIPNTTDIKREFVKESAIDSRLFDIAIQYVEELDIDPLTKEVKDTPLDNLLGWKYTRFTQQAKPTRKGACFIQESGEPWQIKVYSSQPSSNSRTGKYYAPKGNGDTAYLPPVLALNWLLTCIRYDVPLPKDLEQWLKDLALTHLTLKFRLEDYCLNIGKNFEEERDIFFSRERERNFWLELLTGLMSSIPTTTLNTIKGIEVLSDSVLSGFLKELNEQSKPLHGYWQWLKENRNIPLVITEGGKKALAALSLGIPTVSLYGCLCGAKNQDEQGNQIPLTLIPELKELCHQRRTKIGFDQDTKPSAKKAVKKGINRLARAIKNDGGQPFIVTWPPELGKGLDDLIAHSGAVVLEEALDKAIPFEKWQIRHKLSFKPDLIVNQRYLPNLPFPENAQLVGIKSAKNTGKTRLLTHEAEKATASGQRVLVIGHRVQLTRSLCERFGINYIEDVYDDEIGDALGYGLCIDSLHPLSRARFNPLDWQGSLVILDEIDQIIWHSLNSSTCKFHRVAILENLTLLLQTVIETGGRIIVADADLSAYSLAYIERILAQPVNKYLIENQCLPNQGKRKLYVYESADALLQKAQEAVASGEKLLIHTSAQKVRSTYSTQNLELLFQTLFPKLKILIIDSETVADPDHSACGAISCLNSLLCQYDLVIASPTIETGVDLNINHFDAVYVIALGQQTVSAVCQTSERLRSDVPRHLYAPKSSFTRIGNGSQEIGSLMKSTKNLFKANRQLLQNADLIFALEEESPEHLLTWGTMATHHNYGYRYYQQTIIEKMEDEGYQAIFIEDLDGESLKDNLQQLKDQNYEQERQQISQSPNCSDEELDKLKKAKLKTKKQRQQQRKAELCRRYQTEEVTPDMVEKDDNGWLSQLSLHFYLTVGKPLLKEREEKKAKKLTEHSQGKVFTPDANRTFISAQIRCLELLDIHQFFNPNTIFTSESLKPWLERIDTPDNRRAIKTFLNQTLSDKDSPMGFAQRILGTMGLKLTCIGIFSENGKRVRKYQMKNLNPDGRNAIFERWANQA